MVAKARTISYGTAKLEYDANKTIDHVHVASELCRHNLYGDTPGEITREMHDVHENHHRNLSKCYFDIVKDHLQLWPIPLTELNQNTDMRIDGKFDQNEGY